MSFALSPEAAQAIRAKDSIKILATVGQEGSPHAVVKNSLTLLDDGTIAFYELIETSQTQKNLVYSIWFNKLAAITVLTQDGKSYQVKGIPRKVIIAGQRFLDAYTDVQKNIGPDIDLSAVWLIVPSEEREQTFLVRRDIEESQHPYEIHVDRIVKEEYR
ncbi:MAG: pyridoxamine 5'-phosphate oxidase family protein [Spirochaetia bacterium]|jgi:hypothetical protein|nr:pyridoxamine 5'-phosphate oxidase family protein [Spirochaetia bacterium]